MDEIKEDSKFIVEWDKVQRIMPTFFTKMISREIMQNIRDLCYGFYTIGKTHAMQEFIDKMNKKL